MKVNILGTNYKIITKNYDEDESFKNDNIYSFCDGYLKEIVMCNMTTYPGWENEDPNTLILYHNCMIKHEIVHAFLFESGLAQQSGSTEAWATNEEMVDWIARQGEKIYNAWQEAKCIINNIPNC